MYYLRCELSDCCPFYCGEVKHNVSAAVTSGLLQVSPVYQGIEMSQPEKSNFKKGFTRLNSFYALVSVVF